MRAAVRAGVLALAVCLLAFHLAGFAAAFGGSAAYPHTGEIAAAYDERVGESVHLWGRVVAADADGFVLRAGALRLRVHTATPVDAGDYVQVYGTLRPDRELDARRVISRSPGERRYTYAVSALSLPVVAAAFLRHWRPNVVELAFVARSADGDGGRSGDADPAGDGNEGDDEPTDDGSGDDESSDGPDRGRADG